MLKKYQKTDSKQQAEKIHLSKEDNMENFNILMALGYFACMLYIISVFVDLDLKLFQLFKFFTLFTAIGFLIPIKLYRKKLTMSFYEYIFFNILSVGPVLVSLMFILNSLGKGDSYIETYKVKNAKRENQHWVYTLEDKAYQDKKYLRTVDHNKNFRIGGNEYLDLEFSDGWLGIRIIESKGLH